MKNRFNGCFYGFFSQIECFSTPQMILIRDFYITLLKYFNSTISLTIEIFAYLTINNNFT